MLSPYDYWQFWRNTADSDVINFLKFFTDLDLEKIENLQNTNINELKILLANEATSMLHGTKAAREAELTAQKTFADKSIGKNLPIIKIKKDTIFNGINILDIVLQTKLFNSKSEIRRLIKGNGIKINNQVINDEKFSITKELFSKNFIKLSIGKKRHIKVKLN